MKILVTVKRVVDFNVRVRAKADGSGVDLAGVKMSMNPFDEIALEEAVRLKEKGVATEVVVLSIGGAEVQEQLRTALAMGADRAIHISAAAVIQPLAAARVIAAVAKTEQPGLILMGKQAIDDDCCQTGQMLAAMLGWPQGTFAAEVVIENGKATVVREADGGPATVTLPLPAVITADLRLNQPRFPTLPNIMKAKGKPINTIPVAELNVDIAPRLNVLKVEEPPKRKAGVRVKDVAELVDKLRHEAKVL